MILARNVTLAVARLLAEFGGEASPCALLTSAMIAFPPPATTICTVAAPSPELPPVTMKVLFLISMFVFRSDWKNLIVKWDAEV
jgi:hypothetical protein